MRLTELYNVTDLQPIKWDDIGLSDSGGDACLWVGTEGSQTRLHYDAYGWNCVCYGLQVINYMHFILRCEIYRILKLMEVNYMDANYGVFGQISQVSRLRESLMKKVQFGDLKTNQPETKTMLKYV